VIKPWKIRSAGHVTYIGEMRFAYKIKVEKTEWNKRLGTHKHRRDDTIKINHEKMFQGYGLDSVDSE
jgi:hypothetical protein